MSGLTSVSRLQYGVALSIGPFALISVPIRNFEDARGMYQV